MHQQYYNNGYWLYLCMNIHCIQYTQLNGNADAFSILPLLSVPTGIPIVLLLEKVESLPNTSKEIAAWTKKDSILSNVLYILWKMAGRQVWMMETSNHTSIENHMFLIAIDAHCKWIEAHPVSTIHFITHNLTSPSNLCTGWTTRSCCDE